MQLPADDPPEDRTFAEGLIGHLDLIGRRQLTLGTLTLLRGYRGDSQLHLRRAIETCAFAAKMGRHPEFAKVWLEAGNDEAAFIKFRDKFRKNLFPIDDAELVALGKQFEICSRAMHSSIYGLATHFAHPRRAPGTLSIDVFDVRIYLNVLTTFMIAVYHHIVMLKVYERLLNPFIGKRLEEWVARLNDVQVRYDTHNERWKPEIERYKDGRLGTRLY